MLQNESVLLEGIIDAISDPIIVKGQDLKVIRCNPAGYKFLGEVQKLKSIDRKKIYNDEVSKHVITTGKIQESQEPVNIRGLYYQKVATPIRNREEKITHIVEHFKNVTEVIEKQQELDVYFSSSLDLLCIASMEGKFLRLNPQWEKVLGYTTEELKNQEILDYLHTDDVLFTYEALKELGNNREVKALVNRYRGKDGTYRWLEWRAKPVDHKIYAVARDITEQEEGKRKLEISEEKYKTLVEQSTEMLYLHDLRGNILEVNKATCNEMGYSRKELLDLNILDLHPYKGDPNFFEDMWEKWSKNQIIEFTTEHKTQRGTIMDVEVRARKIIFGGEEYIMALVRDVTEKRRYQENLIRAKTKAEAASVAKTRFLANMSHEIRTPMNGIQGFLQLLEETPLNEEQKDYIEHIQSSSTHLLKIINDILDLAKIESGEVFFDLQPINLKEIMENLLTSFEYRAKSKGLDYQVHIPNILSKEVYGDITKIMQIVTNIITNAIKFTPEGRIEVNTIIEEENENRLTLLFSVTDSGIGLKKSDIKKVLLPFNQADDTYTRRYGGTGLGLAIVKELVDAMGGELFIESLYGFGSTFNVRIPLEKVPMKN